MSTGVIFLSENLDDKENCELVSLFFFPCDLTVTWKKFLKSREELQHKNKNNVTAEKCNIVFSIHTVVVFIYLYWI